MNLAHTGRPNKLKAYQQAQMGAGAAPSHIYNFGGLGQRFSGPQDTMTDNFIPPGANDAPTIRAERPHERRHVEVSRPARTSLARGANCAERGKPAGSLHSLFSCAVGCRWVALGHILQSHLRIFGNINRTS